MPQLKVKGGVLVGDSKEVFLLLTNNGPLCRSQISFELIISLQRVNKVLSVFEEMGVASRRPDPSRGLYEDMPEVPWGLVTLLKGRNKGKTNPKISL